MVHIKKAKAWYYEIVALEWLMRLLDVCIINRRTTLQLFSLRAWPRTPFVSYIRLDGRYSFRSVRMSGVLFDTNQPWYFLVLQLTVPKRYKPCPVYSQSCFMHIQHSTCLNIIPLHIIWPMFTMHHTRSSIFIQSEARNFLPHFWQNVRHRAHHTMRLDMAERT